LPRECEPDDRFPPARSVRVVVAGGAGAVGEGVARALARAGATVIAADRDRKALENLPAAVRPVVCDLARPDEVASLAADLAAEGGLDALVIALGGFRATPPLTEVDVVHEWERIAARTLRPQLVTTRHLVPLLRTSVRPRFLFLGGSTAEHPEPGAPLVSVAAAAQLMAARALATAETRVESAFLLLEGPVRSRKLEGGEGSWMDAEMAGRLCARWLIEGFLPAGEIVRVGTRDDILDLLGEGGRRS